MCSSLYFISRLHFRGALLTRRFAHKTVANNSMVNMQPIRPMLPTIMPSLLLRTQIIRLKSTVCLADSSKSFANSRPIIKTLVKKNNSITVSLLTFANEIANLFLSLYFRDILSKTAVKLITRLISSSKLGFSEVLCGSAKNVKINEVL